MPWEHATLQKVAGEKEILETYEEMRRDFPPQERIPLKRFRRATDKEQLHILHLREEESLLAYAVYQNVPEEGVTHIMYLGVHPEKRGQGAGSHMLHRLKQKLPGALTLEVDDPCSAKDEEEQALRLKRIAFYQRNGMTLVPNVKLRIYNCPMCMMTSEPLDIEDWLKFSRNLYNRMRLLPTASLFIHSME